MYNGVLLGHPLMAKCHKFVSRHKPLTHRQWLQRIEQVPEIDLQLDFYNSGPAITLLEHKMAELLGKERALFVHKGMVGQNAALLQWAEELGNDVIAIHPQSHIAVDESNAYEYLLHLEARMFGKHNSAITERDIDSLPEDLAAIVVELPLRRAGFRLPQWQTLEYLQDFAESIGVPVHIDGARLLEAACYWQKSYAEVADIGNSVYVSLYKTLGAAAGGVIAGESDFIEELIPWRSRMGGDLFTAFPYVLSALWGLEHYLPRIPEFHQRAKALAQAIESRLGELAIPMPVQCNGFLVQLPVNAELLESRALKLAEEKGIWLFDRIYPHGKEQSRFEIQVGDALDDWQDAELVSLLEQLTR